MSFFQQIKNEFTEGWIGINLVLALALLSRFLHGLITQPVLKNSISEILVAVLLGLYVGNAFPLSKQVRAGAKFALQRLLRLGIILLGLRLSLQDVAATGVTALLLVLTCITIALTLAYFAGRIFHVPPRLAALIGIGTAICGNTAIVAAAPVIEADEEEMGFAVATITLFGLLAVLFYPLIGHAIGLSDRSFGLWAGTAVNDTSQVVAVGAMYSETSLNVATIVKLTRNTMMAPLIVLFGLVYSRVLKKKMSDEAEKASRLNWKKLVPGFVVGFLIMALLRTLGIALGIFPQSVTHPGELQTAAAFLKTIDDISKFLILIALAGVGLNTNLGSLRRIGIKSLLVGTCVALILAAISLGLILFTPLGA
ncbi:MAG: putative sulfate exporter family transporter [Anaerolineaceae bacterium]|nr:putative sulfate exporter family transporter [Anaerolineaceae bacterium]